MKNEDIHTEAEKVTVVEAEHDLRFHADKSLRLDSIKYFRTEAKEDNCIEAEQVPTEAETLGLDAEKVCIRK